MITDSENTDMPDRMNIWTTIGGYGAAGVVIFLMFFLAQTVGN